MASAAIRKIPALASGVFTKRKNPETRSPNRDEFSKEKKGKITCKGENKFIVRWGESVRR
jgi:hypothetical protein